MDHDGGGYIVVVVVVVVVASLSGQSPMAAAAVTAGRNQILAAACPLLGVAVGRSHYRILHQTPSF